MKVNLYSIRDNVVNEFHPPFVAANDAEATRIVSVIINRDQSMINQHAIDYSLHYLALLDTETGEVQPALITTVHSSLNALKTPEDSSDE